MRMRRNLALWPKRSLSASGEATLRKGRAAQKPVAELRLCDCASGETLEVLELAPKLGCAQRLRELGIIEGARIVLMRRYDPFVVLAMESRIAIDGAAARRIKVAHSEK